MKKGCNVLFLTLATALWGISIVSQAVGNDYMGPCTFNVARFVVGTAAMVPCLLFRFRRRGGAALRGDDGRDLLQGGILAGAALFFGITLQQMALLYLPAGKTVFITSLYMVMVPVASVLQGRRAGVTLWLGVAGAMAGMYLLCMDGSFQLDRGELIALGSAVGYTCHIFALERYSRAADCLALTAGQFVVAAALSAVMMGFFETPNLGSILRGWKPVLYSGVMSGAVAYSLQALGQKGFDAGAASLLLSLETVYGAIGAWLILGQRLSAREIAGCTLMFAAVVIAQRTRHAAPVPEKA